MNRVRRTRAKAARIAGGWDRSWKRLKLPKDFPIRRSPLVVLLLRRRYCRFLVVSGLFLATASARNAGGFRAPLTLRYAFRGSLKIVVCRSFDRPYVDRTYRRL